MRKSFSLILLTLGICSFNILNAQSTAEDLPKDYKKRHAIYDYERALNHIDSIPDFASKKYPIKITGTVFLNDGLTPAKDVIVYINQTDDNGNYELKKNFNKRYVYHSGWVKTNADGQYTFYTFIPGANRLSKDLRTINITIKEPDQPEYNTNGFVFDNDPRLTQQCRNRIRENGVDNILKPIKQDGFMIAKKDIILKTTPFLGFVSK